MSGCAAALSALVRRRAGLSDKEFIGYWRDVHGTLAARVPYSSMYRIHRLRPTSPLLLSGPRVITTRPRPREIIDGIAELRWESDADLERWEHDPILTELVSEDEQNVFGHCAVYWAFGENVALVKDDLPGIVIDGRHGLLTIVVLVRRSLGVEPADLRAVLRSELGAALAAQPGLARLTLHLLDSSRPETWDSPNVTHQQGERPYDAWLELTFRRLDDLAGVLRCLEVEQALARIAPFVSELHAYREDESYTLRFDSRPTLIGLRGYPAAEAILGAGAINQMMPGPLKITAPISDRLVATTGEEE
jgi:hypothetical protein